VDGHLCQNFKKTEVSELCSGAVWVWHTVLAEKCCTHLQHVLAAVPMASPCSS